MVWDSIKNRPLWLRCTVAVLAALLAAAIRLQFLEVLELRAAFLTFYPAVAVAALYGGLGAGLLATVVSAALANYFWIEQVGQFGITNYADLISMVVFLASGALISYLAEAAYRAQARAHKAEEQAKLASERKRSEVLLQRQAELLHISYDAIIVWPFGGPVETWNKGAEELYGYSQEEALGRITHDLLKTIHPEPWPQIEAKLRERKFWEGELKHRARDGREVIVSARLQLVRGTDGVERVLETNRDITERKQAEDALRESEERLRMAQEAGHVGVWDWNLATQELQWTPELEAIYGLKPGSVRTYQDFETRVHPDDLKKVEMKRDEAVAQQTPFELEFRIQRPQGEIGWVHCRGGAMYDHAARPIRIFGVNIDITERKQMEEELRASEERLRLAHQAARIGAFEWNVQTNVNVWTPELEYMYGLSKGEFGKTQVAWEQLVHPEDRAAAVNFTDQAFATGESVEGEWRVVWRDGSVHWIAGRFQVLNDATGKPLRLTGVNIDITERKQMEEELRKSEERFRVMADSIPQLAWIARADGYIYWYNQRWHEYTGTTPEQMEGWGWQSVHDPDALPGVLERWKESIATGEPFDMVFPLRGADGSFREFLTRIMPVKNANGDLIQWCGTNTDITERKQAEARLVADLDALTRMHALSVRLLETGGIQSLLQEIMDSAVMIVGAKMGTLQLLEDDSLRIVAAHGHQQPFLDFFASAESQASVCGEATKRGERVVVSDVETSSLFIGTPSLAVLREAGVRAVQSTPMMSRDGALLGILTTQWGSPYTPDEHDLWRIDLLVRQAADLIDHSQAEEALLKSRDELELRVLERTTELNIYMAKLEQSNQALQDFAHIAAHDMKEPLRKVISFGNMLRKKSGDSLGESGNDYLDRMLNATKRMQSLLTGLLDYSRVATALEPLTDVDLSYLIGEVLSDLEVRIVKTGGEVQVGDLPVISADPTQMRQLFQNLIGNALKFHKPGEKPMVQVRSVSDTDSGCQIIVEDNGIGFEEQYLDRIFAPFQRLHGRSEYEGTGMGLAICKKIVERHGGSITATSTPGTGTYFIVRLPPIQSMRG